MFSYLFATEESDQIKVNPNLNNENETITQNIENGLKKSEPSQGRKRNSFFNRFRNNLFGCCFNFRNNATEITVANNSINNHTEERANDKNEESEAYDECGTGRKIGIFEKWWKQRKYFFSTCVKPRRNIPKAKLKTNEDNDETSSNVDEVD